MARCKRKMMNLSEVISFLKDKPSNSELFFLVDGEEKRIKNIASWKYSDPERIYFIDDV